MAALKIEMNFVGLHLSSPAAAPERRLLMGVTIHHQSLLSTADCRLTRKTARVFWPQVERRNTLGDTEMDMSKAALPARYGNNTKADEQHPLFPLYRQYRSGMSRLMVDCSDFRDWLFQYEQQLIGENAAKHSQYPAFLAWMRETQGGARKCPAGSFPHNMFYWIEGGRW